MIKKILLLTSVLFLTFASNVSYAQQFTENDLKDILEKSTYYEKNGLSCTSTSYNDSSSSAESDSVKERKKIMWQYLIGKGLTPIQAAGLMGNVDQESAHLFEPRLVEYGQLNSRGEISVAGQPSSLDDEVSPDRASTGAPGYGIVQWTSPNRKQGLRDLAKERGVKAGTLLLQLDYLWFELNNGYKAVLEELVQEDDLREATKIILTKFEKPGDQSESVLDTRTNYAEKILKQFTGLSGADFGGSGTSSGDGCNNSVSTGSLVNCESAIGNEKIVCAAQTLFGYPYAHFDHVRSNCVGYDGKYIGYPPSEWLKIRDSSPDGKTIDGKNICLGCSGFVDIAIYLAFGLNNPWTSSQYWRNDSNFKKLNNMQDIKPGDLLILNPTGPSGSGNHIAIVESYDSNTGKLVTLESAASLNDDGKELSGRYSSRTLNYFGGAVRYIGPGSGEAQ